jgi:hypothetical protein
MGVIGALTEGGLRGLKGKAIVVVVSSLAYAI